MVKLLKCTALAAVLAGGFALSANAAVIYPVSVVASSSYSGYPAADAIDQGVGSALSDWASNGQGTSTTLEINLGSVVDLQDAVVTDRVTSGSVNNAFFGGTTDFTTQFELQAYTDNTFTTTSGAPIIVDHTVPVNPTQPSDFAITVNLGGLTTQYLEYSVLATNGGVNPGLSDIHFDTAVPEPATWALMLVGFGGLGVALRGRRRVALATA